MSLSRRQTGCVDAQLHHILRFSIRASCSAPIRLHLQSKDVASRLRWAGRDNWPEGTPKIRKDVLRRHCPNQFLSTRTVITQSQFPPGGAPRPPPPPRPAGPRPARAAPAPPPPPPPPPQLPWRGTLCRRSVPRATAARKTHDLPTFRWLLECHMYLITGLQLIHDKSYSCRPEALI